MKKLVILGAAILGVVQMGAASPACISGTLAGYISLGLGGCAIGNNTVFGFQSLGGTSGATEIMPSLITVTPTGSTFNPGLTFTTNITATTGTVLEALFNYSISGSNFVTDSISLSNLSGSGSYVQNFCQGGNFGPNGVTGCAGLSGGLAVVGSGTDTTALSGQPNLLGITDDLTIDGFDGPSTGATAMDQVTSVPAAAVPEPATYLVTGLGLAFAVYGRSRLLTTVSRR